MARVTITLREAEMSKLQERARELDLTPEDLVRIGVEHLLASPGDERRRIVDEMLKEFDARMRRLA